VAFADKVAAIMSTSPGGLGGLRCLVHLRSILGNIRVIVLPDQIAVPKAFEIFNPDGTMKDSKQQESVEKLGEKVANVVAKLNG
jgi:NAD(P)H-dependent FMN reductase